MGILDSEVEFRISLVITMDEGKGVVDEIALFEEARSSLSSIASVMFIFFGDALGALVVDNV